MNETELEKLVVRLVGDGSSYQTMLKDAAANSEKAAAQVEAAGKRIEGITNSIKGFGAAAVATFAAYAGYSALKGMFESFSEREKGMIVFSSILKAQGRDVDSTLASYKEFAKGVAGVTTASAGSVMQLLKVAETMNLTGDAAKRAAENAMSLATAGEVDAETAIRITAALEQGDIKRAMMFSRQIRALRGIRDETEFVTRAQNLMNAGFEAERIYAGTAAGKIEQMGHIISSLKKDIGGVVAEAILPFVKWMREIVDSFKTPTSSIRVFWDSIKTGVTEAFSAAKAVVMAFWDVVKVVFNAVSDFVGTAWRGISGGAGIAWHEVIDFVKLAADFIAFSARNADVLWNHTWTGIKLSCMIAIDFMKDAFIGLVAVATASAKAIGAGFEAAFAGDIEGIGGAMSSAYSRAFDEVAHAMGAGESSITKALRKEFADQGRTLGESFAEFRLSRNPVEAAAREAERAGIQIGKGLNKGLGDESKKADAALRYSSEAISRIQAHIMSVSGGGPNIAGHANPAASNNPSVAANNSVMGSPGQAGTVVGLLTEIRDVLKVSRPAAAGTPQLNLNAANL